MTGHLLLGNAFYIHIDLPGDNVAVLVCRLHTVYAFTRPAVSQDLGQDMAQWQQDVLKKLAAPDSDDMQVSQILASNGF